MKREAIATMVIEHQLSERHACTLVGLSRDSYRNPARPSELNTTLSHQISEIAHTRRRAGYRSSVEYDQAAGRCVQRFWKEEA